MTSTETTQTTELMTAETADHTADLERLAAMQVLGKDIKKTQSKLTRQQTKEAGAEAELKEERAKTRTIETELEELHNDLATLAAGGNVERLPFKEAEKPEDDADAWKRVPVGELGIKPHIVEKLTAAGVKTFADLEAWRSGAAGAPAIAGLGKAARQNVDDAVEDFWEKHPRDDQTVVIDTPADGAPLAWVEYSDGGWGVENTAGVKRADGTTAVFNLKADGDGFKIDLTDPELLPDNFNAAARWFTSVDEAKAFCAQRNRDLAQSAGGVS